MNTLEKIFHQLNHISHAFHIGCAYLSSVRDKKIDYDTMPDCIVIYILSLFYEITEVQELAPEQVYLIKISENIYAWILFTSPDTAFLFGPVTNQYISLQEIHTFSRMCGLTEEQVPYATFSLPQISELSCLCAEVITQCPYCPEDIIILQKEIEHTDYTDSITYRQTEDPALAFSHDYELIWLNHIKNGTPLDMQHLSGQSQAATESNFISRLRFYCDQKRLEYLAISLVTLASRCAMQTGVASQSAMHASDFILRKIQSAKSKDELINAIYLTDRTFTYMVQQTHKLPDNISPITQDAISFITENILNDFNVTSMAHALGVNRSSLSRVFSQDMHMTVKQYILQKRLEIASELLLHGSYSIGEIADMLHFPSASSFTTYFKEKYGKTPTAFRQFHPSSK